MVRTYKKKTERGSWSEESMRNTVTEVVNGRMGYYRAATTFQVPQTTLERKVKKFKSEMNEVEKVESFNVEDQLGPLKGVFTPEEEQELVDYIKVMENRLFGLTANEVNRLAYQLAVRNNKQHNFNQTKESDGKDWLRGNPSLSFRKPEQTSAARAMAFNKVNVSQFFGLLGEVYDQHKFTADRIYNCDESRISAVSKNTSKILATKGKKQVGSLSSAERGKTVSVEFCMSAAGGFMPPMLVYPRQRMKPELLNNCSPGMWAECHVSGWMQKDIFEKWFDKFIVFSQATKEKPVLLLLDGHSTHIQSLTIIDKARANGVVILCFPPHCTDRLQPLDVSFMKPLSTYYDQELTNWLRSNPGKVVTMFQIAEILGKAFLRAATMLTAINGFKKNEICSYEPNIFPDSVFEASITTDIPLITSEAANIIVNSDQGSASNGSRKQVIHRQTMVLLTKPDLKSKMRLLNLGAHIGIIVTPITTPQTNKLPRTTPIN
ncbi:uncharacterized protein [Onthophagus taurus]|uniref:uncharacterized protein n=1 Tax=Onthophagus taurus TaxID=166361 RepID=UPI0039BE226F